MHSFLQAILINKNPKMFRQLYKGEINRPIKWGISADSGWFPLIYCLMDELAEYSFENDLNIEFNQIKQKHAGLRCYFSGVDKGHFREVRDIIFRYEKKSEEICEICGAPGEKYIENRFYQCVRCKQHQQPLMHNKDIRRLYVLDLLRAVWLEVDHCEFLDIDNPVQESLPNLTSEGRWLRLAGGTRMYQYDSSVAFTRGQPGTLIPESEAILMGLSDASDYSWQKVLDHEGNTIGVLEVIDKLY